MDKETMLEAVPFPYNTIVQKKFQFLQIFFKIFLSFLVLVYIYM